MSKITKIILLVLVIAILGFGVGWVWLEKNAAENTESASMIIKKFPQTENISENLVVNELPNYNIGGRDYIGVIKIGQNEVAIKKTDIENGIIKSDTFKGGFMDAKNFSEDETIIFMTTNGKTYQYQISKIRHIKDLNNLAKDGNKIMLAIRDYLNFEWIVVEGI